MYSNLKSLLKKVLPDDFIFQNEESLRKLTIPFYTGNKHKCNICGKHLRKFATLPNGESICPVCGSLPRARRLYKILSEEFIEKDDKVLDFSPSRALYRKFNKRTDINYFASDFENEFLADYHYDITQIACEREYFNLIICYHILEHIIDDEKAMSELYRILKKKGTLLVQTPYKDGETYENKNIKTPKERLKHFGQDNHVRIYSVKGLVQRLRNVGFTVNIRTFPNDDFLGLAGAENILICTKD